MSKPTECVKVAMRCRPLSNKEVTEDRKIVVQIEPRRGEVVLKSNKNDGTDPIKTFTFDMVFDWTSTQDQVYQQTGYPIVESVLEGYNGTIFAYGQTGTGKTFTMEGVPEPEQYRGIIPRASEHIFKRIEGTPDKQFLVRASFLELYNEEVRDLLSKNYKNKLELREKPDVGVYVKDLSAFIIQNTDELKEKINFGRKNRHVGETKMNQDSSRSHSIFSITIETIDIGSDGDSHVRVGKLNLVDLAGSERQAKTQATGDRFKEAININQSLSTLGNVISALVDPKSTHIPYRDSKLTRLLQDSLGGNTKTVMVANIGPADYNIEETLSTLRYASRAKNIQNKPKINEDPKDTMIRQYQEEIEVLKAELARKVGGVGAQINPDGTISTKPKVVEVEKIEKIEDIEKMKEIEEKLRKETEEMRKKVEQEREQIEKQKNLAEDEKARLLKKLEEKEKKQKNMNEDQINLVKKIKDMEEKLLQGDKLKEQKKKQEQDLARAQLELENRIQQERRLAEERKLREEMRYDAEQKFISLKDEIEVKTKKMKTLMEKVDEAKQQKIEIQDVRAREKDILMEENRNITRELKLLDLIIQHFLPDDEVKRLERRLEFSEECDDWVIKETQEHRFPRPCSAIGFARPMCEYSRMAVNFGDPNARFRYDNIMQFDLDLPERTTEELEETISQKVQETINIALNEDEDELSMLFEEGKPNVYVFNEQQGLAEEAQKKLAARQPSANKKPTNPPSKQARPQSGRKTAESTTANTSASSIQSQAQEFPKSKGLVKK